MNRKPPPEGFERLTLAEIRRRYPPPAIDYARLSEPERALLGQEHIARYTWKSSEAATRHLLALRRRRRIRTLLRGLALGALVLLVSADPQSQTPVGTLVAFYGVLLVLVALGAATYRKED